MAECFENGGGDSEYETQYKHLVECFFKGAVLPSDPRLDNLKKFQPKPTDVILLCPMKCGSTWMQQIMHGVRTRGSMDFNDINAVIPLLEVAVDDGYDIHGDQPYSPRCFKSHWIWEDRPKDQKYIVVVRDPKDSLVSLYEFYIGWVIPEDAPIDIFAQVFAMDHLDDVFSPPHDAIASWWPYRNDPNTLWLHYEDLKEDLPAVVELITEFMGFDVQDKDLLDVVTKQASFQFMKEHEDKFRTELRGLNPALSKGPSKVNKGRSGRKTLLPKHTLLGMDEDWKKFVQPVTGFSSYSEMRDHVNREFNRPWAATK
ncbi:hypothetical protein BSKO_04666 [Bryopsis sp. KO-2023]|nr:hypothetical protein BSKO_04666 [Bryopsis sp. KO-2023]